MGWSGCASWGVWNGWYWYLTATDSTISWYRCSICCWQPQAKVIWVRAICLTKQLKSTSLQLIVSMGLTKMPRGCLRNLQTRGYWRKRRHRKVEVTVLLWVRGYACAPSMTNIYTFLFRFMKWIIRMNWELAGACAWGGYLGWLSHIDMLTQIEPHNTFEKLNDVHFR